MRCSGGIRLVGIAALPPPVSTGSGSKGLSQSMSHWIPLAAGDDYTRGMRVLVTAGLLLLGSGWWAADAAAQAPAPAPAPKPAQTPAPARRPPAPPARTGLTVTVTDPLGGALQGVRVE